MDVHSGDVLASMLAVGDHKQINHKSIHIIEGHCRVTVSNTAIYIDVVLSLENLITINFRFFLPDIIYYDIVDL